MPAGQKKEIRPSVPRLLLTGAEGVGAILMQSPQLMLCKPSTNDRWDRRAVELAAYAYKHGHCNVPEVCHQAVVPPSYSTHALG